MGLFDDGNGSEPDDETQKIQVDEEATLANGKESPFHNSRVFSTNDVRTPTMRDDDVLGLTRFHRKDITESEEIWGELQDNIFAGSSPFPRRRSSGRSNPLSNSHSRGNAADEHVTESTALLARSSTSRSYRDRKRRRSMPTLGTQEREREDMSASSQGRSSNWWKIKSWWKGNKSKVKGKGISNGNRNMSGDDA